VDLGGAIQQRVFSFTSLSPGGVPWIETISLESYSLTYSLNSMDHIILAETLKAIGLAGDMWKWIMGLVYISLDLIETPLDLVSFKGPY